VSAKATGWALDQELPPVTKLVLVALADECRRDSTVSWPGRARLAKCVGISERQVSRHVRELEKRNLVRREERRRDNGSRTSNRFWLAIEGPFHADWEPPVIYDNRPLDTYDEGPLDIAMSRPEPEGKSRTTSPLPPKSRRGRHNGRRRRVGSVSDLPPEVEG
jgi:DNA-binding transcriptional ArsR family regulator